MGASSSIESFPQRHIHICRSKIETNLQDVLETELTNYGFLVSSTNSQNSDEICENKIKKSEIVLICMTNNTSSDFYQLRDINYATIQQKRVAYLVLQDDLSALNQSAIGKNDRVFYRNQEELKLVESFLRKTFAVV